MKKSFLLLVLTLIAIIGIFYFGHYLAPKIEMTLEQDIQNALAQSHVTNDSNTLVHISMDGRNVSLEGYTSTTKRKDSITQIAQSVFGIGTIRNNLAIQSSNHEPLNISPQHNKPISVLRNTKIIDKIICDPKHCNDELEKAQQIQEKDIVQ